MTRPIISALLLMVLTAGCATQRSIVPPGTTDADQYLYTQGQKAFEEHRWVQAREYFRQIVDNYPQSQYRPDAKLAVGDTYLGAGGTEALLLGINEFREFLTFYPTNARADYAQYRLGVAYSQQMLGSDRDQSATRDSIKELDVFIQRYPNSKLRPEVDKLLRAAHDRLSESSYRVGFYYFRVKWYTGALDRFREILSNDPEYTARDAVYFYLAESLMAIAAQTTATDQAAARKAEALPYYERVVNEFDQSEFLERSRQRVAELKTATPAEGR